MSDLTGYALGATDGEAGRIVDLRVDASHWAVHALVVDVGRPVLVSSRLLSEPDAARRVVPTALNRDEVEKSPHADTARSMRSARELIQQVVEGLGDGIGRVTDLLVEDQQWVVRHLIVALDPPAPSRSVMVPVDWVSWGSEEAQVVRVALRGDVIATTPGGEARSAARRV